MKKLTFCQKCGSKNVYWDKYFNEKGYEKWILKDYMTDLLHRETCNNQKGEDLFNSKNQVNK